MKINDIIASDYRISDIVEYLDFEQFYLVEKIDIPEQKYLLHNLDLSNNKTSAKELIDKIKSLSKNPSMFDRFAPVIDILSENNNLQIIYENIEGITLQEQIKTQTLWTEEEAIINLQYLLESIDLLHQQNLIHQIIKPQNLILSERNHLIINNYGQININNSPVMMTITIEDKLYIPPETIRGKTVFSSDIYSLGMIIISMLTGKNAIELDEDKEGKLMWTNQEHFDENLVIILNKMIHPQISKRYQNIPAVITDIKQYFPAVNQNNSGYIPTEIIPNDDQLSNINPTQIVDKNEPKPIDKTQLIFPNYIEDKPMLSELNPNNNSDIKNSSNIDNISNIKSSSNIQSSSNTKSSSNIQSSSIEPNTPSLLNESNNKSQLKSRDNSSLNQQDKLFVHTHFFVNFITKIKTPTGLIISFGVASLIIFSFAFLKNYLYEKKVNSILEEITALSDEQKYNDCIVLINSDKVQSLTVRESIQQEFLGKCQLGLAELEALDNNFAEAIKIALRIDSKSSDYNRAREFINDWSKKILEEAETMYAQQQECSMIEEKLANIPESSRWKKDAFDLIQKCKNKGIIIDMCPGPLCVE